MGKIWKACLAELIGTFTLIYIGAGAVCLSVTHPGSVDLVGIALAHGLAIAAMVASLGHISGGHFNPAVTIAMWLNKKITPDKGFAYIVSQLAGGSLGAVALKCIYPNVARAAWLGTPALDAGLSFHQGICIEAILTFFLIFVIFGTAVDSRGAGRLAPFAIGLTITLAILMGGPLTGVAINPARAFGPALVSGHWLNHSVYWIGPILGAAIAGWVYNYIFLKGK